MRRAVVAAELHSAQHIRQPGQLQQLVCFCVSQRAHTRVVRFDFGNELVDDDADDGYDAPKAKKARTADAAAVLAADAANGDATNGHASSSAHASTAATAATSQIANQGLSAAITAAASAPLLKSKQALIEKLHNGACCVRCDALCVAEWCAHVSVAAVLSASSQGRRAHRPAQEARGAYDALLLC
jgi:hypothetical protein